MDRYTRLQGIFTSLLIYLFNIYFGVPSKGALPPGPPHGVPQCMLLRMGTSSWLL